MTAGDAYAMSHLSAEACTQRLAAWRGDGYPIAATTAAAIGRLFIYNGRALDDRYSGKAACYGRPM